MERISNGRKESLLPLRQRTGSLTVSTSGQAVTIAAPGAGLALQVTGYVIRQRKYTDGVTTATPQLYFATSGQIVWGGTFLPPAANDELIYLLSGLAVQGNENEALTLINGTVSGGTPNVVVAFVFYRTVVV